MGEFEFIAECLAQLAGPEALDLKDDVAVWQPPQAHDAVISMDTIVEGVHFPNGKFDAQLAQKLIRVNVSDIVAKGADPVGYLLSLCLPTHVDGEALQSFCTGLAQDQGIYGLKLWGGDTTRTTGPAVLSLTILATLPNHQLIRRSSARVGDVVCVTGTIGDGYLGLQSALGQIEGGAFWENAYHMPTPPYTARHQIRRYASASLDISDGLIADAGHMAKASKIGVELDLSQIPMSAPTRTWLARQPDKIQARLVLATGGDDYQTLMAMSASNYKQALRAHMPITKIGVVIEGSKVRCHDGQGNSIIVSKSGYTHF